MYNRSFISTTNSFYIKNKQESITKSSFFYHIFINFYKKMRKMENDYSDK
ncbi:hypothetical protein RV15_GL003009 [Enterococcus silesiacus]|uniref:Uncharacterized protein n=1 Tax=Enterococcus silesiacus TaxID=332949 RepID=A0AA91GFX1_9ENTE|nr:hypothetical protein RV15_GL003009 [Enterococcus silesiacus]